jgi:hypothetical protein
MELGGNSLVVEDGEVLLNETVVGYLYENGFLRSAREGVAEGENDTSQWRLVDDLDGCRFEGRDSQGLDLVLPGPSSPGPSGTLRWAGRDLNVIQGRISDDRHSLLGEFDARGGIYLRDKRTRTARRQLDEGSILTYNFNGIAGDGRPLALRYVRPLSLDQFSYAENEISRYFQGFERLSPEQQKYVLESMQIWASSGLLQVVRKSEGNAALGNVKHGAAGVTRVRTGMVDLDSDEFERDIDLCKRFGPLAVVATRYNGFVEVRVNLVVSHEFGHQLQFSLTQAAQDRINELYQARLKRSLKMCPPPPGYEGGSELVRNEYLANRLYISGYAKASVFEYWAESVAAFSLAGSRRLLRELDPGICKILEEVVFSPEKVVRTVLLEPLLNLQASLALAGEFTKKLLD